MTDYICKTPEKCKHKCDFVWEFHPAWNPAWHGFTNDISLGRNYLFIWPIEDKGSVRLKPVWKLIICTVLFDASSSEMTVWTFFTVCFSIVRNEDFFFF